MRIENLPWAGGAFGVELLRVTQASSTAGSGVESVSMTSGTGSPYDHAFDVLPGESGVYVLELTEL